MNKIPIFICGGHFSPAIAVIESLLLRNDISLYYLGRKYEHELDLAKSLEYSEITKLNIPFLELKTGRLNRFISASSIVSLLKLPLGFIQSFRLCLTYKPKMVISFGGYIALPVCIVARFFGIPIITHEQTRIMGLSNKIISLFADTVCLTFPDTKNVPSITKTITTGMPLRNSITDPKKTGITDFGNTKLPLIYITGGSQGSASINAVIFEICPQLLKNYRLFHVCGESRNLYDYHRLNKQRAGLNSKLRSNYYLMPKIDYTLVGEVLNKASLIISRAGANTVSEIAFFRKTAILIPLPWAGFNEQNENAKYLESHGRAVIIDQSRLKPNFLLSTIKDLILKSGRKLTDIKTDKNAKFIKDQLSALIQNKIDMIKNE